MKKVLIGACAALMGLTSTAFAAEFTLKVRGKDYPLTALMDSCLTAAGGSEAQLRCFVALAGLVKEQSAPAAQGDLTVTEALAALRSVAELRDVETALTITGDGCKVQVTYYNNYYHLSRRNVTSIDLYQAEFDAAQLDYPQTTRAGHIATGVMQLGGSAISRGGTELSSADLGFASKPLSQSVTDYVGVVAAGLTPKTGQAFDFVLVHPSKEGQSAEIWTAFEGFVTACRAQGTPTN